MVKSEAKSLTPNPETWNMVKSEDSREAKKGLRERKRCVASIANTMVTRKRMKKALSRGSTYSRHIYIYIYIYIYISISISRW